jgi:hypothetical protein
VLLLAALVVGLAIGVLAFVASQMIASITSRLSDFVAGLIINAGVQLWSMIGWYI